MNSPIDLKGLDQNIHPTLLKFELGSKSKAGKGVVKEEDETIRFPTNLDHTAIVLRLIQFRKNARANGLPAIAEKFMEVESMSAATIASNVVSAITWLQDKVEYRALTRRLEMVAMNLKNLR